MTPNTSDWDTVLEMRAEMERDARGCPYCGMDSGTVLCDGCKFEICNACNYPCACGGEDGEALF